jgi:hypothetical protein
VILGSGGGEVFLSGLIVEGGRSWTLAEVLIFISFRSNPESLFSATF